MSRTGLKVKCCFNVGKNFPQKTKGVETTKFLNAAGICLLSVGIAMIKKISFYLRVFKKAFMDFIDDNAFKLSAALSYYTIFAIGPLLLIIMSLAGLFFGKDAVQGKIYGQIKGLVGSEAAIQIQSIIQNISHSQNGTIGAIIGFVILVIGATGVFTEMQDS